MMSSEDSATIGTGRRRGGRPVEQRLDFDNALTAGSTFDDELFDHKPTLPDDASDMSEPTDSIEIGGDNECDCSGAPDLAVAKDEVGEWRVQLVSCDECGYLLVDPTPFFRCVHRSCKFLRSVSSF